jgi:uncharacterized membrane protein YedE/YeeE
MLKYIKFLITGVLFGIIMAKAEIISWYRIYEMFQFDSFHMYGIIGSAVILGVIIVQIIKRTQMKNTKGDAINFHPKNVSITRYLVGGTIFGLGWALAGACPGPMFVLLGYGYAPLLLVIVGALLGTFTYGLLRKRLPH